MNIKRWFPVVGGVVFVGGVLGVALRESLMTFVMDRMTADMFVQVDDDAWSPGPAVGVHAPMINAVGINGAVDSLEPYAGPRGLLLFFNRSVDW